MADVTATPGMDPAPEALVDDRTARGWPLPHRRNKIATDNERLRAALSSIDTELTAADTFAAATDRELARYEAATDETLAQHRTELDALDRDKANEASVSQRFESLGASVQFNFDTLCHDDLHEIDTGTYRHLTHAQQAALPAGLSASNRFVAEARVIAEVDLGAAARTASARIPDGIGLWASVKGLGIFRLDRASAELPDGETCILPASGSGRWLLQAPAPEEAVAMAEDMLVDTVWVAASGTMSIYQRSSAYKEYNIGAEGWRLLGVIPPAGLAVGWSYTVSGTTVKITFYNDTDAQISVPPPTFGFTVLSAKSLSVRGRRLMNWLLRARPSAADVGGAMTSLPEARSALAEIGASANWTSRVVWDAAALAAVGGSRAATAALFSGKAAQDALIAGLNATEANAPGTLYVRLSSSRAAMEGIFLDHDDMAARIMSMRATYTLLARPLGLDVMFRDTWWASNFQSLRDPSWYLDTHYVAQALIASGWTRREHLEGDTSSGASDMQIAAALRGAEGVVFICVGNMSGTSTMTCTLRKNAVNGMALTSQISVSQTAEARRQYYETNNVMAYAPHAIVHASVPVYMGGGRGSWVADLWVPPAS